MDWYSSFLVYAESIDWLQDEADEEEIGHVR